MIVNFGYIIDNELAGCAHPDSYGDVMSALAELHERGIGALVSLDEYGILEATVEECGMRYLHIPIEDFHAPRVEQAKAFVEFVEQCRADGLAVAAHCRGGYGRTGTLLACYLISQGKTSGEAIDMVRTRRPGSIETAGQEKFLQDFESRVRKPGKRKK